jgi:hypothetical protein
MVVSGAVVRIFVKYPLGTSRPLPAVTGLATNRIDEKITISDG